MSTPVSAPLSLDGEIMLSELLVSDAAWVNFCLSMWRNVDAALLGTDKRFDVRGWPFHNFRLEMCATRDGGLLQYAMLEGPEAYPPDPSLPRVINDIGLGTVVAERELVRLRDSGYTVTVDGDGTFTNLSTNFGTAIDL